MNFVKQLSFVLILAVLLTEGAAYRVHRTCKCKYNLEENRDVVIQNRCGRGYMTWTEKVSVPSSDENVIVIKCICKCISRNTWHI